MFSWTRRAGGGKRLLYAKGDCSRPEYETRLFLHLYPVNPDSLPPERRDLGFRQPGFLFEPIRRPPRRQLPGGRPLARLPHR